MTASRSNGVRRVGGLTRGPARSCHALGDEHPGQYIAGRAYQRVGKNPAEPLSVALFPAEASDYLRDVRFTSLCFGESTGVIVEDAFAEIYRPTDWDQWSRPELLRPVAPRPKPPADEPPGGPV